MSKVEQKNEMMKIKVKQTAVKSEFPSWKTAASPSIDGPTGSTERLSPVVRTIGHEQ